MVMFTLLTYPTSWPDETFTATTVSPVEQADAVKPNARRAIAGALGGLIAAHTNVGCRGAASAAALVAPDSMLLQQTR
jgi:hypothetical protein